MAFLAIPIVLRSQLPKLNVVQIKASDMPRFHVAKCEQWNTASDSLAPLIRLRRMALYKSVFDLI